MAAQLHSSPEIQHEAMYEAMWRRATDREVQYPSDQDTKRLKAEVDEMRRFMQNQQDQLLVAIRTATRAAMAATEESKASAWFGDEGARQSVLAPASATAGPHAPVEQDSARYAGMAEAATPPHPTRSVSAVPATSTDRLPPVIGEAIESVRKEFTKDVRDSLRAKQRADKSCEELATFDDAKMTLPTGIKPFTSVTTLAELDEAMEGSKTQQLVFGSQKTAGLNAWTSVGDGVLSMFEVQKTGRQRSTERTSETCGDGSQEANIPGSIIGTIKRIDDHKSSWKRLNRRRKIPTQGLKKN